MVRAENPYPDTLIRPDAAHGVDKMKWNPCDFTIIGFAVYMLFHLQHLAVEEYLVYVHAPERFHTESVIY